MIEAEQEVTVQAAIEPTWNYAKNMQRWAAIMPGYQNFQIIDDDNSRWVLKVGVGALVRTVNVLVHVERWAGPEAVDFTFKLEGDPVEGGGAYRARPLSPGATQVCLKVQVTGSGTMAPMWEAMGGPILPKFAKDFAEELKAMIEAEIGGVVEESTKEKQSLFARLFAWVRTLTLRLHSRQRIR